MLAPALRAGSATIILFPNPSLVVQGGILRDRPAAREGKPEQLIDFRFLDALEKSGLLRELCK